MKESLKNINYTYIFIVATFAFLWFLFLEKTAYDWPASDMIVFFKRFKDPTFLMNDFYTNSITNEPNPRWIFGYLIIFITEFLNIEWYSVFYGLKIILFLATPVLFYVVIFLIIKKYLNGVQLQQSQIFLCLTVVVVIVPEISALFSIAWWPPFFVQSTAQSLSLVFGLLGMVFSPCYRYKFIVLGMFLFALATLFHPAVGLFMIAFYLLGDFPFMFNNYKKNIVLFLGGFLIPAFILKLLFDGSSSLGTLEFIKIYVLDNHSAHFHTKDFGTLTSFTWLYSFILINVLFLVPMIYFIIINERKSLIVTFLFFCAYSFSVLAQYLFIDIFPSKTIATIGPVRFSFLGYWMLVISWVLMLARFRYMKKINFIFNYRYAYLILFLFYVYSLMLVKDNPLKTIYKDGGDFVKFLERTPKDAVFCVYPSRHLHDIPNITNRAVFIGNGFPFNQKYFKEHNKRFNLVYGSRNNWDTIGGSWIGESQAIYYRGLKPKDFKAISKLYRLDYVVIESKFKENFKKYNPVFQNQELYIYKSDCFD